MTAMDEWMRAAVTRRMMNELDLIEPCLQPGCRLFTSPWGSAHLIGVDHDYQPFYMQRWICPAGHIYDSEVPGVQFLEDHDG